jgi:hypothetical protein
LSLLFFTFAVRAFADDNLHAVQLPSGTTSIESLRGVDSSTVEKFVNAAQPGDWGEVPTEAAGESGWAAIGQGKDAFVVLLDFSGRGLFNRLRVYSPAKPGQLELQELFGWRMGKLKGIIRDLDSNGEDELVIPTILGDPGGWLPMIATRTWPAVYWLEDGKYVEASPDFPSFYDKEILPQLDKEIRDEQQKVEEGQQSEAAVALDEIQKDKILRVLGRDPTAGLQQAYQWMDSGDSLQLQCAIATFEDIGGHEKELAIAKQALQPAIQREQRAVKSKRSLARPLATVAQCMTALSPTWKGLQEAFQIRLSLPNSKPYIRIVGVIRQTAPPRQA